MRRLTILRHAKSSWGNPDLDDFDRPLNERGRHAAEAVGRELQRRQMTFDCVLASPALRVRQTLELVAKGYGELPDFHFKPEIYAASLDRLLAMVGAIPKSCRSALMVGHNPGLQQLVLALTANKSPLRHKVATKYPTAAATVLHFAGDGWSTAADAELVELILPRELDGG